MPSFQYILYLHRLITYFFIVGLPKGNIGSEPLQTLTDYSPFLAYVSSTSSFDSQFSQYVNSSYVESKWVFAWMEQESD